MTYPTLDYLPDLTPQQMASAGTLIFSPYTINGTGVDHAVEVYGSEQYAILHSLYKFSATAGATYSFYSTSFFDPYVVLIYDVFGNAIVANNENDDPPDIVLPDGGLYGRDVINNWVAPYSGIYYVNASWNQGSYYTFYDLTIYEDIDTANHAPIVNVPLVNQTWQEGLSQYFAIPASTFFDADGDTLYLTATLTGGAALPGWLSFNPVSGTFSGTAPLGGPDYSVRVTVTDSHGASTFDDVLFSTQGDSTPPSAPTISSLTDDVSPITGIVLSGGTTDDQTLLVSGTAEANSTVALFDSALQIGTAGANAQGNWSILTGALSLGSHSFTAKATDAASNQSAASIPYVVNVAVSIVGTGGADVLVGTDASNLITALSGNDKITGAGGNDSIDGGLGIDTAKYLQTHSQYSIGVSGGTVTITALSSNEGTDLLTNVERLAFGDENIAFDLSGAAGMTAKLLGVIFGPSYVNQKDFVGMGLALFDFDLFGSHMSETQVADLAIHTNLFSQLAGSDTNAAFASYVYHNLVGYSPDPSTLGYIVSLLDTGIFTQASLAVYASELAPNLSNIGFTGLTQHGLEYFPYVQ